MVVANVIPSERRLTCESRDIECREISEKSFRDVAAEFGYQFASGQTASLELAQAQTAVANPSSAPHSNRSNWSFNRGGSSPADKQDFLSRCDEEGRLFFSALFDALNNATNHTRVTWKHESGFSVQFYFYKIGFAPVLWGFPSRNREGKTIRQRLDFPFDFSIKGGVSEQFINEFATSVSSLIPFSGGGKRPSITISQVSPEHIAQIIETILSFAAKASKPS